MDLTTGFSNLKAHTLNILSKCPANNSDINTYLKVNSSDSHKGYFLWNILDHPFQNGNTCLYYHSTKKNLVSPNEDQNNTSSQAVQFQICLEEDIMMPISKCISELENHRIRQCDFSRKFIKHNGFEDYNCWFTHNLIKLGEQNGAFNVERENGRIKYITSGIKYTQPKMENTFQEFISQKRITASVSEYKFNQVFLKLCPSLVLIHQKTFKDLQHLKPLRYDFYTETLDGECILFEIDGKEHRNNHLNDQVKERYASKNDYKLVRIKNENVNKPYLQKLFTNHNLI